MANNLTLSTIDPISGSPAPSYDTTTAKFGQALAVGTASSAVGVPVAGFTAECWSKGFPSAGTGQPRIMLGSSTIFWIGAQAGLTNIVGSLGAGGTAVTLTGPTLASLGSTWHHFALTCGPGGCTLWVDGVSAATTSTPIASTGATSGAGLGLRNFETGPNYYGPFTWNNNEIDEVALFSGIRYTAAFTPPAAPYAGSETNLLALFHLDGNGTDSSGVAPANAVGAPVVSGTTAGGTSTISGTTTGAAPTGLTYSLDSGAAVTVTVPTLGSGTYSFTITTPAAGAHTISVTGTGPNTTTGGPTSFTSTSSAVVPSIYPDDPAMLYSPSNWQVLHGAATAWNPGAYFRTLFSGTSCTLNFDVSNNATPFSQIWYRVDNGPWTAAPVAATIVCAIPALTAGNADLPFHLIEVWFKSMDSTGVLNRWTAPAQTAIRYLGLTLAAGGAAMAPGSAPIKVVVFGDSIVEGIRTLGEAVSTTPDDNDALFGWVAALREHLGAEIGFVGWGGTGYGGTFANVPVFGTSLASLAAGVARSFTPSPDLIIINHGTNDAGANIQAAATAAVNALLAATTCPIVLLNPLPTNRQSNAYLAAVPAASNIPARVHYVSSAGFMVNAAGVDTTLFHPSGPNGAALIAPKVAAAVMPFLASPGGVLNRWTHNAFTATGAAPSLGAVTVTGLVQGGGTTITGTYANGTPTGLTYSILGGAPVTVSSPTIGGGTYSFSIATPTAGTYLITVTGTGGNTATSSSVGFTTAAAGSPSIGIPSVSGLTVGGTTTLTGSYANGTPTGLTYSLDSGAAVAATSPTISGGNYSFTVTTPTAGAHNVTVTGTGPNTATSAAASFTTAAAGNNAAFYTVRKTPGQTGSGVTTLSVSGIASTGTANMTPGNLDVVDGGGSPIGQAAYITLGASSTAVPVGAAAGGDFAIHNQDYGATSLTNSPNTYTSATAMYIFANGHAAGTTRTLYWWIVQNADRTKGGVLCDSGGVPIPFTANY